MNEKMPFTDECIIHFALRYALPRRSTASLIVAGYIKDHLSRIDDRALQLMESEITTAINLGQAGDPIDISIWAALAQDINKHLKK